MMSDIDISKLTAILTDWLLRHESDIAWGLDDFDELREAFKFIIGREPKK